jgi:hypothetical protein
MRKGVQETGSGLAEKNFCQIRRNESHRGGQSERAAAQPLSDELVVSLLRNWAGLRRFEACGKMTTEIPALKPRSS